MDYIEFVKLQPLNAIKVGDGIQKIMNKIILNPTIYAECENIPTKSKIYREAVYKIWQVTRFSNKIIFDYDTNPNKIICVNINIYAINQGITSNIDVNFTSGLKIITGVSFLDNRNIEKGISEIPPLTERFSGTWNVSYKIKQVNLTIDYTGNIYGTMRLPLLGDLDPLAPNSPTYSIQNIQFTYSNFKKI